MEVLAYNFRVQDADCQSDGGQGEIRTRGGFNPTPAFQASALNHYATCPISSYALGRKITLAKRARDSNEIEWKVIAFRPGALRKKSAMANFPGQNSPPAPIATYPLGCSQSN
jgi:hypothetical protein